MAKHPVVSKCKVSKTLLGAWKLEFECPGCQSPLTTKETAIGTVDDCQLCGAQFLISPSVREHIAAMESEAESQTQEAEKRKEDGEEARLQKKRQVEIARRQEQARERQEREQTEHSRGYDYPNLRKYQSSIEATAIGGAILLCLLGAAILIGGFTAVKGANGDLRITLVFFFGAGICIGAAASWYFWWMVVAEVLRLTITVALDVRAIRDNNGVGK